MNSANTHNSPSTLWPLIAIAFLSACGGGGSNESAATTPAAAAPLPAPTAVVAPASTSNSPSPTADAPTVANDFSCALNDPGGIQAEVMQRINALRASGAVCGTTAMAPVGPLTWNNTLLKAARAHSADMAANNYFSHTGRDGRSAAQRISDAGYNYRAMGENIAAGQTSVQSVMAGWTASEGHCRNLMNAAFVDVAVACVRNDAASYRLYWSMELAKPQ